MRTFQTLAQIAAKTELEQLVADYWREVDFNGGANAPDFFTEDVVADFGAITFTGHDGIRKYYADRAALIREQQAGGVRTTRHICLNLQIVLESDTRATLNFVIATYAGPGTPPVSDCQSPVAISDTRFECRREADGQWRVFGFYGAPVFLSNEDFARTALTGR